MKTMSQVQAEVDQAYDFIEANCDDFDALAGWVGAGTVIAEADSLDADAKIIGGKLLAPEAPVVTDEFVYQFCGESIIASKWFAPEVRAALIKFIDVAIKC